MRWLVLFLVFPVLGCQLREEMQRAEDAYEQAHYDQAHVWLSDLEQDTPDMDTEMQARFYYLRGMTAYRLGHRNDALHFLALAREVAGDQGRGLGPQWKETMDRTLVELTPHGRTFRARDATDSQAAPESSPTDSESAGETEAL